MINISHDTLLIMMLVGVLAVYTLITLDDNDKEKFTTTDSTATTATTATTDATATTDSTDATATTDTETDSTDDAGNGSGDTGSNTEAVSEKSKQNIVQSNDKKTTVVHNHYYGGNKGLAKFMSDLINKQNQEKKNEQSGLVDQGMCSELNNKLKTKTLAEIQNDRVLSDLQNKCNKFSYSSSTCKIQPPLTQTALIGTLLSDAKDTSYGSLLPKIKTT